MFVSHSDVVFVDCLGGSSDVVGTEESKCEVAWLIRECVVFSNGWMMLR
jgi:hypothetical protein